MKGGPIRLYLSILECSEREALRPYRGGSMSDQIRLWAWAYRD
jgi:hypothetical protein